jgi:triacylglycerol lipase
MAPRRRCAAWVVLAVAAGLTACGGDPAATAVGHRDPIVFVHGLGGHPGAWATMQARFRADGWPAADLDAFGYDSRRSNVETARRLAAEVRRVRRATGAAKVDIVTHSMGALSSRYYLQRLGGTAVVDRWVSLAGPDHGITGAPLCPWPSCGELRAGSAFLAGLNHGDETPGPTRYATWWSPCDTVVNPDSTVALRGARNTRTACLSHAALIVDAKVYEQVRDFVLR